MTAQIVAEIQSPIEMKAEIQTPITLEVEFGDIPILELYID
jgi:hypothetical protein